MKIAIIVAMEKEFRQLETLLAESRKVNKGKVSFVEGTLFSNEIVMMQCGIGKVNAAIGVTTLIHYYHPDLVISSGVAGGASADMEIMDVVVSSECVYHDVYCGKECAYGQLLGLPARFKSPQRLVDIASSLHHTYGRVYSGLTVTGDWFVDDQDKMRTILGHFPEAKAVDMESCSIAQACHQHDIPFISFRIISDIPIKDTDASQYFDFWKTMADGSFEVLKQFLEVISKQTLDCKD